MLRGEKSAFHVVDHEDYAVETRCDDFAAGMPPPPPPPPPFASLAQIF